jgi:hypothetical protein
MMNFMIFCGIKNIIFRIKNILKFFLFKQIKTYLVAPTIQLYDYESKIDTINSYVNE